jgi:hypothetical protein
MASLKYRVDIEEENEYGQILGFTSWMAGKTLARVKNCHWGPARVTAYVTGEPDTFFSQPARVNVGRRSAKGYLTCEDGLWTFHTCTERP